MSTECTFWCLFNITDLTTVIWKIIILTLPITDLHLMFPPGYYFRAHNGDHYRCFNCFLINSLKIITLLKSLKHLSLQITKSILNCLLVEHCRFIYATGNILFGITPNSQCSKLRRLSQNLCTLYCILFLRYSNLLLDTPFSICIHNLYFLTASSNNSNEQTNKQKINCNPSRYVYNCIQTSLLLSQFS